MTKVYHRARSGAHIEDRVIYYSKRPPPDQKVPSIKEIKMAVIESEIIACTANDHRAILVFDSDIRVILKCYSCDSETRGIIKSNLQHRRKGIAANDGVEYHRAINRRHGSSMIASDRSSSLKCDTLGDV